MLGAWMGWALLGLTAVIALAVGRRLRDKGRSWALLPLIGAVPALAIGVATMPWAGVQLGAAEALSLASMGLLGTAWGGALALSTGPSWNLRAQGPAALAVAAITVEGAALLGWVGVHAPGAPAAWPTVLASGGALAVLTLRQGALPTLARWTQGYRVATGLCALGSMACWWGAAETRAMAQRVPLVADVTGNAASIGAWGLWIVTLALSASVVLGLRRPWVRRLGMVAVAGTLVLLPIPLTALRASVRAACEQHLPDPSALLARLLDNDDPDTIAVPQGWCRAPIGPTLDCPTGRTEYTLKGGRWHARRLDHDVRDSLWGATWTLSATRWNTVRRNNGSVGYGDWVVVGGARTPEDLATELDDWLVPAALCLERFGSDLDSGTVHLVIDPGGGISSARVELEDEWDSQQVWAELPRLSDRNLLTDLGQCLVSETRSMTFPPAVCSNDQTVSVQLEWR